MIYPRVNPCGTSPDTLMERQRRVSEACELLIAAMVDACPEGCDYQTQLVGTFFQAQSEYLKEMCKIHEIKDYADNVGMFVAEQLYASK